MVQGRLREFWIKQYSIEEGLLESAEAALELIASAWRDIDDISSINRARVLRAFQEANVTEQDFFPTTGYGYGDGGRERLERVFSQVFGTEAALVRWQISSGTHAITLCLQGILRPGDRLVSISGKPYDTLGPVLQDLQARGVDYHEVDFFGGGGGRPEAVKGARMVLVQRSPGYAFRPAITMANLERAFSNLRAVEPECVFFVDNCYGEFTETEEPPHMGADLIAGSLMKNPGGGIAPSGGYVAGRSDLVEMAAERLTAPGLGGSIGPSLGFLRLMFQGFFLAPGMVKEALQGATFAARLFKDLGFPVCPEPESQRSDIIQAVQMGNREALLRFCEAFQRASAVDSLACPVPSKMPGYDHEIIMAAGTFIQGATLELSADGPLRPPYTVFIQGGLAREQAILACLLGAQAVLGKTP